jgi:hypothetical protein
MNWLQKQWNDIKGNVKYALVLVVLGGIWKGVVAKARARYLRPAVVQNPQPELLAVRGTARLFEKHAGAAAVSPI